MTDINLLSSSEQQPQQPIIQQVSPLTIPAHAIQPRHIQSGYFLVKVGLASVRPVDGTSSRFYFSSDTFVMSYYDIVSETWKSGSAFA